MDLSLLEMFGKNILFIASTVVVFVIAAGNAYTQAKPTRSATEITIFTYLIGLASAFLIGLALGLFDALVSPSLVAQVALAGLFGAATAQGQQKATVATEAKRKVATGELPEVGAPVGWTHEVETTTTTDYDYDDLDDDTPISPIKSDPRIKRE